ncbi:aldehyde reductase [Purpureocillium lavendulum]|uniref:Aldehyde reductase n=1 Tax=Purpureocillium lavendulum TaxID=1247861 RepID=A0AB34FM51_9HYPO|nr:aldehyde reductase [Purpureocillium lavendulum]
MQLKRGVERESCDFCHRRKIKCDRALRMDQGQDGCSQCSLRQLTCCLDDSDDVRIRNKRRQPDGSPAQAAQRDDRLRTRSSARHLLHDDNASNAQQHLSTHTRAPSLPSPFDAETVSLLDDSPPDLLFLTNPLELSLDAGLFLDHIFMEEPALPPCPSPSATVAAQLPLSHPPATQPLNEHTGQNDAGRQDPWISCGLDSVTFNDALHAYFDLAALCMPVLLEDAFWEDYRAGTCSPCLVFAVACRGMPFIEAPGKWDIQQRLAGNFRDAFFEAQRRPAGQTPTRLDDLEALAIMLHFKYSDADRSSLDEHFENLFLTHDSLVLMMLRSAAGGALAQAPDTPAATTRANDRRKLLFWHVYGLDAFNNMDYQTVSRIADSDADAPPDLLQAQSASYLDTILALAVIARRIMQRLCTVTTRRRGVKAEDVASLYDELAHWRQNRCAGQLQRPRHSPVDSLPIDSMRSCRARTVSNLGDLHRAVAWLLEINCSMQIENLVDQYGIQDAATLSSVAVSHRVEYESLRAVDQVADMSSWLAQIRLHGEEGKTHSLIDLAPSILRDVCKGLCVWTCLRATKLLQQQSQEDTLGAHRAPYDGSQRATMSINNRVASYRRVATSLRDAVASAVSHSDTGQIVAFLDEQIAALDE